MQVFANVATQPERKTSKSTGKAYYEFRVAESQRAAEIRAKLDKRLEEGVRAGDAEVGALLKTEQEALADAAEVGLVVYNSPGSYDRKLLDNDRRQLEALREHYDGLTMDDKNAANVARVLMDVAEKAAALTLLAELLVSVGTAIAFGGESLSPMGWAGGALITFAALAEALFPPANKTMTETSPTAPVTATGTRTP